MNDNHDLFWRLFENEYQKARAYCARLTDNPDDGDDLLSDSVLMALKGFPKLRQTGSFRRWLYRIIGNAYKARFRNPWWKKIMTFNSDIINSTCIKNPACYYEAKRKLSLALSALSPDDHILVTLSQLEGWKISELAELTGKTEGNIKMRLSRARKKMRDRLSTIYQGRAEQTALD